MEAHTIEAAPELALEPARPATPLAMPQAGGALAESSPAGIMLAALSRGVSPADLREMLALQREWQADQARAAFHAALAGFKAEAVTVLKRKQVGFTSKRTGEFTGYKHAELFDVVEAVGPALARHGLSYRWDVEQARDLVKVTCILTHAMGHSERCAMSGPPDASGQKNALQQIASAITYLQRYTLKSITGVAEGGQDDDAGGPMQPPQDTPQQGATQQGAADPGTYSAAEFDAKLPEWREYIAAGKKTPAALIATVESKGRRFTQDQRTQLCAITPATKKEPQQ